MIVDNRPGGGTNIGTQAVVSAAPDGYTLLFTASTHTINVSLQQLPFNFLRDITMVVGPGRAAAGPGRGPEGSGKTLAEFVAYAKANPGKVNVASFGATTISHLAIEFFKVTTGANVVHVPYRGGAQIMADLISGQIDAAVDLLPSSLPHIKRGAIRALAVLSAERSAVLPDLPAANEIIPGLEVRTFSGVGAPSGTPPEIVERLNKEINAGLANPTIKARFADAGASTAIVTSAEANAFVRAQTEKWAKVIKAPASSGIAHPRERRRCALSPLWGEGSGLTTKRMGEGFFAEAPHLRTLHGRRPLPTRGATPPCAGHTYSPRRRRPRSPAR